MKVEYTPLRGGNRIKASFDYSVVSSTANCCVEEWSDSHYSDKHDSKRLKLEYFTGDKAIEEIRRHIVALQEFTTLHDRAVV